MTALQNPRQYTYGIPPWDNKSRTYFRKQRKHGLALYSKQLKPANLPRKAKKRLKREYAESVWEYPSTFFLMPLSDEDPVRRQFYATFGWRNIPGAYVSPLAPTTRRKKQPKIYKRWQRNAMRNGALGGTPTIYEEQ